MYQVGNFRTAESGNSTHGATLSRLARCRPCSLLEKSSLLCSFGVEAFRSYSRSFRCHVALRSPIERSRGCRSATCTTWRARAPSNYQAADEAASRCCECHCNSSIKLQTLQVPPQDRQPTRRGQRKPTSSRYGRRATAKQANDEVASAAMVARVVLTREFRSRLHL